MWYEVGHEFDSTVLGGRVRVVNGLAAGGAWYMLEVLDGPRTGARLWVDDDLVYWADVSDDGFLLNQARPDPDNDEGGAYFPDLDGQSTR